MEGDEWKQFECTDCLLLEFHYQAYKITENSDFQKVDLIEGKVDLKDQVFKSDENSIEQPVRRTENNERSRPNAERRHDP